MTSDQIPFQGIMSSDQIPHLSFKTAPAFCTAQAKKDHRDPETNQHVYISVSGDEKWWSALRSVSGSRVKIQ